MAGPPVGDVALLAARHLETVLADDLHFGTFEGRAVRRDRPVRRIVHLAHGGEEVLRTAVEAEGPAAGKDLTGALDDGPRDRRPGAHPEAHAARVVLGRVVRRHQHLQERRRGHGSGATVLLDPAQPLLRVPRLHQVGLRAGDQGHDHAGNQARRVGYRRGPELHVLLGVSETLDDRVRARAIGVEGVEATLRPGGRARGVHDEEAVVGR